MMKMIKLTDNCLEGGALEGQPMVGVGVIVLAEIAMNRS